MEEINEKLKQNGIILVFLELEKSGYYDNKTKIMFVNQNLNEHEVKRVIYHELKHALDHSDYVVLYKKSVPLMKMESEANEYMVKKIIEENGGIYNYTQLIQEFKIGMGTDINYANH